ncbi:protein kinase C-binding protein NELL2-like protein, partial [Leptotrombidium deliense]
MVFIRWSQTFLTTAKLSWSLLKLFLAMCASKTIVLSTPDVWSQVFSEVDIIEGLNLHNSSYSGLSLVQDTHHSIPTIHLSGNSRHVQLPQYTFEKATYLLSHSNDVTFMATVKQDPKNSGAIISFSEGHNNGNFSRFSLLAVRYLEIQSSGRRDEIRFLYRHNKTPETVSFPYHLADGNWHQFALSISGNRIDVYVDCNRIYRRIMFNLNLTDLQQKLQSLWLGQRNDVHFLFKGYLRDVKLVAKAYGYSADCPRLETDCPTCGQFKSLQSTVSQLEHYVKELSAKVSKECVHQKVKLDLQKLRETERRLAAVEECECFKSCQINGTFHPDGATWKQDCDICSCQRGKVSCRPVPCLPAPCKNFEYIPGQCCPVCKSKFYSEFFITDNRLEEKCRHNGKTLEHREKFSKDCITCECNDGTTKCKQIDPKVTCPRLNCSVERQIRKEGACCKFCNGNLQSHFEFYNKRIKIGTDFCALGHDCHESASCHNLLTEYSCFCKPGFWGNGKQCFDVNECAREGGHKGHLCQENTRCVNIPGAYVCECLPGYRRKDSLNCIDIDECQSKQHNCDTNAECINNSGSYKCRCLPGYVGDGVKCEPVCNETCKNGGKCVAPNVCSCRRGYEGHINECLLENSVCVANSVCVNMPGWYYCQCKPGYKSIASEVHKAYNSIDCKGTQPRVNNKLRVCFADVDECSEDINTCHESTQCVNFEGGYRCDCHTQHNCSLNCSDNGIERFNGERWPEENNLCSECSCHKGVVTCHSQSCNCNDPQVDVNCCPQCDISTQCRHQEDNSLMFKSGDTWIYQCQICECMFGEVDCWDYDCPPVSCSNPTKSDGDCCPRCDDDPCDMPVGLASNKSMTNYNISNIGCMYLGRAYQTGERIPVEHDPCASCKCK